MPKKVTKVRAMRSIDGPEDEGSTWSEEIVHATGRAASGTFSSEVKANLELTNESGEVILDLDDGINEDLGQDGGGLRIVLNSRLALRALINALKQLESDDVGTEILDSIAARPSARKAGAA